MDGLPYGLGYKSKAQPLAVLLSLAGVMCLVTAQAWSSSHADIHQRCCDYPLPSHPFVVPIVPSLSLMKFLARDFANPCTFMPYGNFNETALFNFTGFLKLWSQDIGCGQHWAQLGIIPPLWPCLDVMEPNLCALIFSSVWMSYFQKFSGLSCKQSWQDYVTLCRLCPGMSES